MTTIDKEIAWIRKQAKAYEETGMLTSAKNCKQAIKRLEEARKDKNAIFFDRTGDR